MYLTILVFSLMMHGRNNGKKLLTVRIVKHSFEIIHLTTGDVSTSTYADDSLGKTMVRFHHPMMICFTTKISEP